MPVLADVNQENLFIGSRWLPANGPMIEVRYPGDNRVVGRVRGAQPADVDTAVAAARASFDRGEWRRTPAEERSALLLRATEILDQQLPELARSMTSELGCTLAFATQHHVPSPLRNMRFYAGLAGTYEYDEKVDDGTNWSLVTREPVGVVAAVTPWNAPLGTPVLKVMPALAAGCSVVLKPSPETPITVQRLAYALQEAGLPEGVFSILPGGAAIGQQLVSHPDVDKVTFTGSTAAGRDIMQRCSGRVARVTLELGGKSAAIVLPDADLDMFARKIMPMAMMLSGQACNAQTRVLVPRSIQGEVEDRLTDAFRRLTVGDPFDEATDIGPLISSTQRDRVQSFLDFATSSGARTLVGGDVPTDREGWFVNPTLISDVDNTSRLAQEEIFGPVLSLIPFDDESEAIHLANASIYGLSGSVWTEDAERGLRIAREIRTGMVHLNGHGLAKGSPFGGYKQSGIGREMGVYGFEPYLETKAIAMGPVVS